MGAEAGEQKKRVTAPPSLSAPSLARRLHLPCTSGQWSLVASVCLLTHSALPDHVVSS